VRTFFQKPIAILTLRWRVAELLDAGLAALTPDTALDDGGQRIAITRAPAMNLRLIVCDAPTSALGVNLQAKVLNLPRDLRRELGVSDLFITHNIAVA